MQTSVAIFGVSKLFREGLQLLLRRSKFAVVCNSSEIDPHGEHLPCATPDLALYALSDGEETERCFGQLRLFREVAADVRIVLLADGLSAEQLRDAAAAGVQAVLSKEITADVLQRALELVMLGQELFPRQSEEPAPRAQAALIPFARPMPLPIAGAVQAALGPALPPIPNVAWDNRKTGPGPGPGKELVHTIYTPLPATERSMALSERERQILRCLVEGNSNKTIARHLTITEATVKVHIKGLLRKIRVSNRTQAAVWGLNHASILEAPVTITDTSERMICQAAS